MNNIDVTGENLLMEVLLSNVIDRFVEYTKSSYFLNKIKMSQSIDFRINDFVAEYLDYKGFNDTVGIFLKERKTRQEPIQQITNGNHIQDADQEKYQIIKVILFVLIKHQFYLFSFSRMKC